MFARHQLATSSPPTRHGKLPKGKNRQEHGFTRHGESNHLGGEQGRFGLPRMTWHKPNGEESFARHGEQEELARRVDADGKSYK